MPRTNKSSAGFTLVEMLLALALGMVVVAAAVSLFTSAVNATFTVSQRAEMQQDIRAAQNMLTQDIGLAGAGMPTGGLALPAGAGQNARYGCDQTPTCHLGTTNSTALTFTNNYLYAIIPGYKQGITLDATQGATDIITVDYTDAAFFLDCYQLTFNNSNGTSVNFTLPATPLPGCDDATTQAVTSPAVGLTPGDLVMFTNGSNVAVGEVSSASGTSSPYTVTFNNLDPLYLNQSTATSGNIGSVVTNVGSVAANAVATRVFLITYYLDVQPDPTGGVGTPRLMRQVSGHSPIPVAENVANMQLTYDTYDTSGNLEVNLGDAGASLGVSPSLIRKVNILHLTLRSQIPGTTGYQGFDVQTSVSARNLTYTNRYQ